MRVLFLTEWFDPLPAHKGLSFVKGLRAAGHEVEVATAFPHKVGPSLVKREVLDGVTVYRLPHYHSHDASGLRRSITYLSFFLSALLFGLLRGRRYDVIYAYHPPITVGLAAALFGGLWRRPFVLDVLDLWPDVFVSSGMVRPSAVRILDRLCRFVYARARFVSVCTKGFRARLMRDGVDPAKISLIYNFADETKALADGSLSLEPYRMTGRFNVVYGGNFGRFQDLPTLIEAARIAHRRDERIQLILIGSGSEDDAIRALAAQAPEVVSVHQSVPMAQIGNVFAAADLLATTLLDEEVFRIYLPQKLQFYLAMGRPIIANLSGEGADVLQESGAGFAVEPGNPQALADAIVAAASLPPGELARMGARGLKYYHATMSSSIATRQLSELLNSAVSRKA